jgi:acetolactate synthase small subunit
MSASAVALPLSEPSTTACFSVHARAEPGVMPRVLELFAKRGLVPSSWHSAVSGAELTIDLQMRGMERDLADYVAQCLRQLADVDVVLTSEKPGAA